jgi:hypothetical protein
MAFLICFENGSRARNVRSALLSHDVIATHEDVCSSFSNDVMEFKGPIKEAVTPPITEVLRKLRRLMVFMMIIFNN